MSDEVLPGEGNAHSKIFNDAASQELLAGVGVESDRRIQFHWIAKLIRQQKRLVVGEDSRRPYRPLW